jgi:Flp pilus assembly pilin Flp
MGQSRDIQRTTHALLLPRFGAMAQTQETERGSASVEQAGLAALIALLLLAAIAAVAAGGKVDAGRGLAGAIAKRIACAPRLPDACHHHPLVPAYGWPLARLARALAPAPEPKPGPSGLPLVPVDFRRCRRESCAVAAGPHLTASRRRTTAFTRLLDRRHSDGWIELTYWLYRPTLGWERIVRRAGQAQIDAAASVPVLLKDDPALVPLETLPGRNHYAFPVDERPPWQWQVPGRYPGWSS